MFRLWISVSVFYCVLSGVALFLACERAHLVPDHTLTGHAFETRREVDWLRCLLACQEISMCISYNYHKKNDICELNSHGFTESCASLQEILVYAPGIVFHQLRPGKDASPPDHKRGIRDCTDALKAGSRHNAVYWIDPLGHGPFQVFCDQTTDGGGWTVLQRRQDGAIDFYRNWTEYSNGFGHLTGEFWLGLDKMHKLTTASNSTLRIELEDWGGQKANATYDFFRVSAEFDNYTLDIGNYSAGLAGDSLTYSKRSQFTTPDRDNDGATYNCAVKFGGPWWHKNCHKASLNGKYHDESNVKHGEGIIWKTWKGDGYSIKKSEMKIRSCTQKPHM